jgi:hypothetical protein
MILIFMLNWTTWPTSHEGLNTFLVQAYFSEYLVDKNTGSPFQTSHISVHYCRKTVNAIRMKFLNFKEEPKELYFVNLKLPLGPSCGVAVTRGKVQLLSFITGCCVVC